MQKKSLIDYNHRKLWFSIIIVGVVLFGYGCIRQEPQKDITQDSKNSQKNSQQEAINENSTFQATLRIEGQNFDTEVESGTTALSLLERVTTQNNITLIIEKTALGQLITTIGNKTNGTDGKYWLYYVNNEAAPVGAADYTIAANDVIEFKFE
ncbi:MAG: hypothetical protein A3B74_00390 [Candidatus Kerfeldbacteria bacterium RIFCSPHIGHO2_02_FULL_42_14]|uniref:Transcobalamin-like C-terminal domain-containing protein n=1 Tax=Candidatus Kerfeldbacteria bacterium RIFCSPHIGHO2_02_FULL_42_14 TaxID=1798540 RepID=A0A1G2AQX8_9BACT|nr:MAG: hypothetical protein A3B74_00390 [Candidatus Kerfeldbacteria bacterium RIFCSPHIGHO2_02_FULL_42_14]OGY81270.1 MAG: hypothetical protein A3E60_02350 [Candidatus Kerfeldbacteria bacterium RIFCSPHIGHO2_12_FULL_42_13]OGY83545.1 MAG: hypothetical protein A3I91_02785 [Candidatus Kerfeldbacteria bacterium RIFCSPLOWO2_02_FULL_42_19]OGY85788.1 MAG: hypothetical protein A3G01_04005 [Candidatus Kerfeldbacteria bacterium RIFCSPLOWO2_12_FULL_43_9]